MAVCWSSDSVTWAWALVSASFFSCSSLNRRAFDGDHGLVGEGLEERDLVIGESARYVAGHRNHPESLVVTEQELSSRVVE